MLHMYIIRRIFSFLKISTSSVNTIYVLIPQMSRKAKIKRNAYRDGISALLTLFSFFSHFFIHRKNAVITTLPSNKFGRAYTFFPVINWTIIRMSAMTKRTCINAPPVAVKNPSAHKTKMIAAIVHNIWITLFLLFFEITPWRYVTPLHC